MKKLLFFVIMFSLLISIGTSQQASAASTTPVFTVDGRLFSTPSGEPAPYFNKDNRTMGSLRLVGNVLGVESKHIKWNAQTETATLTRGTNTVEVVIGKKEMNVNGKSVTMDTVAEMKQGRVFIPVRYIAQGLGVTLQFNAETGALNLFTKDPKDISMDNFDTLGLKRNEKLPISMTSPDGLKLTVHSAYIYKTSDAEAKALDKKYDLWDYNTSDYLVWASITFENTSKKRFSYDYRDLGQKVYMSYASGKSLIQSGSNLSKHDKLNNSEILYFFALEAGEKITSNVAFVVPKGGKMDRLSIGVTTNMGASSTRFVEK